MNNPPFTTRLSPTQERQVLSKSPFISEKWILMANIQLSRLTPLDIPLSVFDFFFLLFKFNLSFSGLL